MPTEPVIHYRVVYSKRRKTLGIQVERDATLVVHAPEGIDPERIHAAVSAKGLWLYEKTRHAEKQREPPHPPGTELVSGESLLYLGHDYPIEIVDEPGYAIRFEDRFIIPRARAASGDSVFREWLQARARETILPRVRQEADALGVACGEVQITESRYRWGSCTPNGDLNFNWRLIKAPLFVIDYVIAHELAHLIEPNHGPRFWSIVRTRIVGLDKAKAWLKTHGSLLEQEL
ncbi:MAG: M48 family peptidase [Gammaproteobacteria bacterium]|nr:M48 family peptidase [Gammaproteobacteria bacterium]